MAEPGGDAGGGDLGRLGQGLGRAARQPVLGQVAGAHPGGVGAQRAQVAQPGEAMRRGAPGDRAGGVLPALAARLQPAGGAQHLEFGAQQAGAAAGIAGPEVAEGPRRRVRHLHRLEAGDEAAGAADQLAHRPAPAGRIRPFLYGRDCRSIVRRAEHRGAGDQHIGPGLDAARRGLGGDAAIDLQRDLLSALGDVRVDHLPEDGDLGELAFQEGLPAEARIDRHHQDQVAELEHVLDRRDRRRRVQHHAGLLTQSPDGLQRAVQMRPGFRMDADRSAPASAKACR